MAKETMKLGEGFAAKKISGGTTSTTVSTLVPMPPPSTRHYVIGWSLVVSIVMTIIYWSGSFFVQHLKGNPVMQERPGFQENLAPKRLGGILNLNVIRGGIVVASYGPYHNTIVNEGETLLRDCFNNNAGTACTNIANLEFHGLGTSSAVIAETDGGCTTELTTQYNPDNTRATGTQTTNGTNVYRTVGTNTLDGAATIEEFCLMDVGTGAGNMWTRILTGTIVLGSGDGLQTTYDLTIE